MVETIVTTERITQDPAGRQFIEYANLKLEELGLKDAVLYYDFPGYADYESIVHKPDVLVLTRQLGILALRFASDSDLFGTVEAGVAKVDESLGQFCSTLVGRLLKSRLLRKSRNALKLDVVPIIFLN